MNIAIIKYFLLTIILVISFIIVLAVCDRYCGNGSNEVLNLSQNELAGPSGTGISSTKSDKDNTRIIFKKEIIREFQWNSGVDSLHKSVCPDGIPPGEFCGGVVGPFGLLANKKGNIYIFDYDRNGEGWGVKLYNSHGVLIKQNEGGEPLGIDENGKIFLTDKIYNEDLSLIRRFVLPARMQKKITYPVIEKNKIYFLVDINDNDLHYYSCDPYSEDLIVDEYLSRFNSKEKMVKWPKVVPCEEIKEIMAPYLLQLRKNYRPGLKPEEDLAKFKIRKMLNNISESRKEDEKIGVGSILQISNDGRAYFETFTITAGVGYQEFISIFDRKGHFIQLIPNSFVEGIIDRPGQVSRYIFIEKITGDVYQISIEMEKATLTRWRTCREDSQ